MEITINRKSCFFGSGNILSLQPNEKKRILNVLLHVGMDSYVGFVNCFATQFLEILVETTREMLNNPAQIDFGNNGTLYNALHQIRSIVLDNLQFDQLLINEASANLGYQLHRDHNIAEDLANQITQNVRILSRHFHNLSAGILRTTLEHLKDDLMADIFTSANDLLTGELLCYGLQDVYLYQKEPVLRRIREIATSENVQQELLVQPMYAYDAHIYTQARNAYEVYQNVAIMHRTNSVIPLVDGLLQKRRRNHRRHFGEDVRRNTYLPAHDQFRAFAEYIERGGSIFERGVYTEEELENIEWFFRQYQYQEFNYWGNRYESLINLHIIPVLF